MLSYYTYSIHFSPHFCTNLHLIHCSFTSTRRIWLKTDQFNGRRLTEYKNLMILFLFFFFQSKQREPCSHCKKQITPIHISPYKVRTSSKKYKILLTHCHVRDLIILLKFVFKNFRHVDWGTFLINVDD